MARLHARRADLSAERGQRRTAPGERREATDVDIGSIPTPVWHEHDGGPFIGTACMVVMKDPDSGWINYGAYRIQSQGPPWRP